MQLSAATYSSHEKLRAHFRIPPPTLMLNGAHLDYTYKYLGVLITSNLMTLWSSHVSNVTVHEILGLTLLAHIH